MKKRVVCLILSLLLVLSFPVSAIAEDDSAAAREAAMPDAHDLYRETKEHLIGSDERSDDGTLHTEANGDDSFRGSVTYFTQDGWEYYVNAGETATITDYTGSEASVTTPTTLGGKAVTQIGSYTFSDNLDITSVTVSEGITQLGDEQDAGEPVLYGNVFEFCDNLTTVNLPASLAQIGWFSFIGCPSLATVTVASGNTIFMVDNGILFSNSDADETYDVLELYPAAKSDVTTYSVPGDVIKISPYAIELNEAITALNLPSSLRICNYGVMNMPNMTTLNVADGITSISGFNDCPKLVNISLPDSVVTYGWRAFAYCEKLTSIVHPSNIKEFGFQAFFGTGFVTAVIPATVETIAPGTFGWCFDLTSISVDASNANYKSVDGVLMSKDGTELITYPVGKSAASYTVPIGVERISGFGFSGAFLSNVTLPSSLQDIDQEAFTLNDFTAVVIPENVVYIGYDAFSLNPNLSKLIVYGSGVEFENYYFDDDMFYINDNLVIYGTGALSYAIKFGIPFGTITTSMSLDRSNLRMWPYTSAYLTPITTPAGGYVTWSSSNPSVASVDDSGYVTANALGTATITGTSLYQAASCTVSVFAPDPVQFTCNKRNVTAYGGSDGFISVLVSPYKSAGYEASIDGGASWNGRCLFTGLTAGTYTVIVRDAYYTHNFASCSVTIDQPSSMGTVPAKKIPAKVNAGNSMTITPPAPPKGYAVQSVSYSSSNPAVATVDASGTVTFLAGGKVTIVTKVVSQTVDKKGKIKTKTTAVKKTITVKQPISSISLPLDSITIARAQKIWLPYVIQPATASDKKLIWISTDIKVASVNAKGMVTGKAGGTAKIICMAKDGSQASTYCTVTVTPIYPTGIKLSKAALSLKTGKAGSLKATVAPKNTDFKTVIWASSNPGVVTVDAKGKLKAIAPGTAVITATTSSGQIASCAVTVS